MPRLARPGYFEGEAFGRFRLGARILAAELHDWWLARIRRELIVKARITQADLELLRHQCQGHSSKRIAAELRVSNSSINSRFQRMNTKLGVPNRRMAARLAVECGLLNSECGSTVIRRLSIEAAESLLPRLDVCCRVGGRGALDDPDPPFGSSETRPRSRRDGSRHFKEDKAV